MDNFCRRGILVLVLAILVFGPLAMGAVDPWAFLVILGLTVGVMFLWGLRLWAGPKPQLLWPPVCWVVLAFAIYAVARYFTADIEYVARLEMIQVLMYAFLFFAIVNNLYRQESVQAISFTLIFLAVGIAAWAGIQFFTHSNRVWIYTSPYPGRASGTYMSPDHLAGFLEMILPLAVAYTLAGRMRAVTRIFVGYAALVVATGVAVTFSRGGWVAAAAGLLVLLVVLLGHRQHRLPALLLLAVSVAAGIAFSKIFLEKALPYISRMEVVTNPGQVQLHFRRDMWTAAERMWLDHFWWGVGPGHYDYRFREYRPERVQREAGHVHNDYLNLATDWGAAGGIIVLAGMGAFGAGLWATRKHVQRAESELGGRGLSNRYAFFVGAASGLAALSVHSMIDFNLHIPANAILGVTLLALLTSNLRFATERYWLNARTPAKTLATAVLAAGVVYLGWQGWRLGAESHWLARAQDPSLLVLDRAALLEKAFAVEPEDFETAYEIGEAYRIQSFVGNPDYATQAETAIGWYARARRLDPYDGYADLRTGMCLDWLGREPEAEPFYRRAEALDPNGYFTVANIGWHYIQTGDYLAAREWLERSLRLDDSSENIIAHRYLPIVEQELVENASGKELLPGGF